MPTQFLHRLHIIIPAARINAANNWVVNNLDPAGGDWFVATLSASGNAPFTHACCSAALSNSQVKSLLAMLARIAGVSLPANWDSRTRAQKQAFILANRDSLYTNIGVYLSLSDNDGTWESFQDALTATGLKVGTVSQ